MPCFKIYTIIMACCPPSAWGELKLVGDYKSTGTVEKLEDFEIYVTGKADSPRCIIWNYDIFGFKGGRTRQLCDILGEQGRECPHHSSMS